MRTSFIPVLVALLMALPAAASVGEAETRAFFERRIASLQRDDGWLSLVGLFRLDAGTHALGSAADADLRVPDRHAEHLGRFVVADDGIRFESDAEASIDAAAIDAVTMRSDADGAPTAVEIGDLLFYVIARNDQAYLRVKDRSAPLIDEFDGVERWEYDPALRVRARLVPHDEPHELLVPDVLGGGQSITCDGAFEFEIDGAVHRLEATYRGDTRWSFIYGDATSGDESYGGGRFLYFDAPGEDGIVTLDFNQSYNPPCVFTPYSTCPLPPEGNVLPVAIRGGEKMWHGHD